MAFQRQEQFNKEYGIGKNHGENEKCHNCDATVVERIVNGISYCRKCSLRCGASAADLCPPETEEQNVWDDIKEMKSRLNSLEQLVADMNRRMEKIDSQYGYQFPPTRFK